MWGQGWEGGEERPRLRPRAKKAGKKWSPFSWDGTPRGKGTSWIWVGEQDDPSSRCQGYVLCPGYWHSLGEFDGGVGAQIPGERTEVRVTPSSEEPLTPLQVGSGYVRDGALGGCG